MIMFTSAALRTIWFSKLDVYFSKTKTTPFKYVVAAMSTNTETIEHGNWVVIQRENYVRVHRITSGSTAMIGRDCIALGNILGQPMWSTYLLESKPKTRARKFILKPCDVSEFEENVAETLVDDEVDGKDNRFINDDGQSQKLSALEIAELRADGASAKDIIGQLVENSSTFDKKTAYAKEKYVNKKQKKYKRTLLVRPTNLRLVIQAIAATGTDPSKTLGLRIDSMSQLLYMSGAQSGAGPTNYLLFESGCQGLVTAAMLERIGHDNEAHLIVIGPNRGSHPMAVQAMNFTEGQRSKVHYFSLASFLNKAKEFGLIAKKVTESIVGTSERKDAVAALVENNSPVVVETNVETDPTKESPMLLLTKAQINNDVVSTEDNEKTESTLVTDPPSKRPLEDEESPPNNPTKRAFTSEEADLRLVMTRLQDGRADCLVVACKENPTEVAELLLPLVEDSKPVVIYSYYREPLQEAYTKLKNSRRVTALRLAEPWLRTYQVLPERTHPEVSMSGSGGYLLTGITVELN